MDFLSRFAARIIGCNETSCLLVEISVNVCALALCQSLRVKCCIFFAAEGSCGLFHYLKVEDIVCIPDCCIVQLAVLRTEPVTESTEDAVALSHQTCFLFDVFVGNEFHITLHGVIVLFKDCDVSVLTIAFIRDGKSRTSPEKAAECASERCHVRHTAVRHLHVAYGLSVTEHEIIYICEIRGSAAEYADVAAPSHSFIALRTVGRDADEVSKH